MTALVNRRAGLGSYRRIDHADLVDQVPREVSVHKELSLLTFGDSVFVTITPRIHYQYELDDLQRDSYDEHPLDRNNVWLAPKSPWAFVKQAG